MSSDVKIESSLSTVLPKMNASDSIIDALGLILNGNSVVDFIRLHFNNDSEIDNFLKLNNFVLTEARAYKRIYHIYNDAINYLSSLEIDIPQEFKELSDIRELFRYASYIKGSKTLSKISCSILKVMHVLHHVESRELMYRSSISIEDLFSACEAKVSKAISELNRSGISIYHYSTCRENIFDRITKLIARKEIIAAQMFEKASFNIITEKKEDVLFVLRYLITNVFPFNYVVPGYSSSNYIDLVNILKSSDEYTKKIDRYQFTKESSNINSFADRVYMKVDIPLDINSLGIKIDEETAENLGFTIFSLTEFTITDVESHRKTEQSYINQQNQRLLLKREAIARITKE
ncbi:MAG: TIGR04552 family protein [Deltaproteobacteria bacterium]|nr:TIGR04552 family protein [Deltaproteobacteria bacterium]